MKTLCYIIQSLLYEIYDKWKTGLTSINYSIIIHSATKDGKHIIISVA